MNELAMELETKGRIAILSKDRDYLYVIYESVMEEGYMVDKYDVDDMNEPMDGGLCTGTAEDALNFML